MTDASLMDRFGRRHTYLRISVTDRCNLRCRYCMPHEGMVFQPREELLSYEEILRLSRLFIGMGVRKIRLTGGEPMVRRDLPVLIEQLSGLDGLETLTMTTNGYYLANQAETIKAAGVQALNISLDTLRPVRFFAITRRDAFTEVMAGIDAALNAGFESLKLNVVVMAGINDDEILDFIEFGKNKPLNIRFIEYMPFEGNRWTRAGVVPYREIRQRIESRYALEPLVTEPSAVAKDFALPGYPGTVSFITSMTDSFCGTCNRLRLTSDGAVKACLFGPAEISLRDPMRAGADDTTLRHLIGQAIRRKQEAHEPMETLARIENRPMIAIGG